MSKNLYATLSNFEGKKSDGVNLLKDINASKTFNLKRETLELLQQYKQNHSVKVRNRLVELNLGLVRKEAHRWTSKCQESFDDLLQVGSIGLITSIDRFNIARGIAFSTFAMPFIRGEIQHYLRDKASIVRLPRKWNDLISHFKRISTSIQQDLGRAATSEELREEMMLSKEEWNKFQVAYHNRKIISLDISLKGSERNSGSLGEMIPDCQYQDFQNHQENLMLLSQSMSYLDEQTRTVLEFVFFRDYSQRETAFRLNISPVTVSRKIRKGISQLSHICRDSSQQY